MKRIFIAIKVVVGKTLFKTVSSLKSTLINEGIRWTSLDNIHITLAFIGETEENTIEMISSTLKESCEGTGKFELTMKGIGVFKNLSDPRVIWTGIEPSENLAQLNNTIINVLNTAGIEIEQRNFKPHLTLGRIKYVTDKPALKYLIDKYQNVEIQKVPVNEVIIYESILKPTGSLYIPVTIIKL
jgi:RNA 2',3'-cyclic 3'-phosphodiesterase